MKRKLLLAALCVVSALGMRAQTDVTSTYLSNADFSQTAASEAEKVYGYGKDGTPYGFQAVDGWTSYVTAGDNANANYPNSGMAAVVVSYGSSTLLQGGGKGAPAKDPEGNAGNCLGFFAVWGCGGYYYQDVTLLAGKYTLTFPIYNQQGTQANTTYTGFFPNSGTNRTVAINTTVGSWVDQTVTFTLTDATPGQIRIGYKSTGSGSGANPHIFFDGVKIEYTALVIKDVLSTALTAATNANATLKNSSLTSAISTAQGVYDDENATQEQVNSAAATLNAATELAMSAAGDVTGIFLDNPGFESCTVTTTNAAAGGNAAPVDIEGEWTQASSAAWSSSAVVVYGGEGQVNGASAPSADNAGNSGNALGVSVGWGGLVTYQSESTSWPAGVYTFKINAYNNLSGVTQFASKFGFVPTEGSATLSTKTSFAYATWETDQVTVTLNEATEGVIQVGGQAISGGSGSNAKVFFDNITITYQSFLAGAKAEWDAAVEAAGQAKTDCPNVTGSELAALNEELAKAEPTTVEGYNAATAALEAATATFTAAKAAYDGLEELWSNGVPELVYATTEKYTAIGDAYFGEGEVVNAADATARTAAMQTAIRAYYESHALAEKVDGAENMTDRITNANNPTNNDGWTWSGSKNNPASNEPWTDSDGTNTHSYFDGGDWNGTTWTTTMKQTVTIPAGKYVLTAKARSAENVTFTMSVGDVSVDLPHVGSAGNVFNRGWGDASLVFDSKGKGDEILVKATTTDNSHQWFSIADFRLVRIENHELAVANEDLAAAVLAAGSAQDEVSALMSTIAKTADPTAADVTYQTIVGGSEAAALIAAVSAAGSVDQTDLAAVQGVLTALTTATTAYDDAKPAYERAAMIIAVAKVYGVNVSTLSSMITNSATTAEQVAAAANGVISTMVPAALASTTATKTFGFEAGQYAPYNNVEGMQLIATGTAIATAPADYTNDQIYAQFVAIKGYTWTANTTEVNGIYNGDWALSTPNTTNGVDVDVPGWSPENGMRAVVGNTTTDPGLEYASANKALFSWGGTTITYGEQTGYTLPLKANTAYELTYLISAWRDGDLPTWVSLSVDGATVYGDNSISAPGRIDVAEGNPFKTVTFKFKTGEAKNYVVKIYANKHFTITDITLTKAPEATANMKVEANKWGTFIAPFEVAIPAGINAYKVTGVDDNGYMVKEQVETTIPANTPVVLENTTGAVIEENFNGQSLATKDSYTVGALTGVYKAATIPASEGNTINYVLQTQNDVQAFYKVTSDFTAVRNRCYLTVTVPAGAAPRAIFIGEDDDATGIEGVDGQIAKGKVKGIYSANGTELNQLQKGLNIVKMADGKVKKVYVK